MCLPCWSLSARNSRFCGGLQATHCPSSGGYAEHVWFGSISISCTHVFPCNETFWQLRLGQTKGFHRRAEIYIWVFKGKSGGKWWLEILFFLSVDCSCHPVKWMALPFHFIQSQVHLRYGVLAKGGHLSVHWRLVSNSGQQPEEEICTIPGLSLRTQFLHSLIRLIETSTDLLPSKKENEIRWIFFPKGPSTHDNTTLMQLTFWAL